VPCAGGDKGVEVGRRGTRGSRSNGSSHSRSPLIPNEYATALLDSWLMPFETRACGCAGGKRRAGGLLGEAPTGYLNSSDAAIRRTPPKAGSSARLTRQRIAAGRREWGRGGRVVRPVFGREQLTCELGFSDESTRARELLNSNSRAVVCAHDTPRDMSSQPLRGAAGFSLRS
jgi:hypothetical protein